MKHGGISYSMVRIMHSKLLNENDELKKENEQLKKSLEAYNLMKIELNENLGREDRIEYKHATGGYAYSNGNVAVTIQEEHALNILHKLIDPSKLTSLGPGITNVYVKIVR